MIIDKRIRFEERYNSAEDKTTTLYFVADVSLLRELSGDKYPEACGMTISVEFPTSEPEARYADVCYSPYEDDGLTVSDYDWNDIDLPYDEINELICMGLREV